MLDPNLPLEVKIPLMVEWYDAKHELLIHNNLYKKDFALMVKESSMSFRYTIFKTISFEIIKKLFHAFIISGTVLLS